MLRLALRNVLRHRLRAAMNIVAVAFGVAGILLSGGFVQDLLDQLGESMIHSQSGHLQIAPPAFFSFGSRSPTRYLIDDPERASKAIAAQPEVADVMGRISFSGLLSNGRADLPILGEGIEPAKESRFSSSLKIVAGRQLENKSETGMLIGQGLARALQLGVGDSVTLVVTATEGAMNTRDFVIEGVFQTYSKEYDTRTVKIPLPAAQELLDTSGINVLVVSLHRTADTAAVQQRLAGLPELGRLSILSWSELNDFYAKTVQLYKRQFSVLQTIILLMVLLSVANSVNMSALERTGEFGTLRALGNRSIHVFGLVVTENALIGLCGAVVGITVGIAAALALSAVGIPMPPPPNANAGYTARILVVPSVVAAAFAIGVAATVLASMLPAWRMSRMSIVDTLRQNI